MVDLSVKTASCSISLTPSPTSQPNMPSSDLTVTNVERKRKRTEEAETDWIPLDTDEGNDADAGPVSRCTGPVRVNVSSVTAANQHNDAFDDSFQRETTSGGSASGLPPVDSDDHHDQPVGCPQGARDGSAEHVGVGSTPLERSELEHGSDSASDGGDESGDSDYVPGLDEDLSD